MIDVSELMLDPDFAQTFDIIRESVTMDEGAATTERLSIPGVTGIIQPTSNADLMLYVPEGERAEEWISVWCAQEIRAGDGMNKFSDVIVWHGRQYRIAKARHWEDQGYYRAWAKGFANG